MIPPKDIVSIWNQNNIWKDLSITHGKYTIDLNAKTKGAHAFFSSNISCLRAEYLANTLQLFAAKYSPSTLNIYGIDIQEGPVYHTLSNLPHCVGMVTDKDKILLAIHILKEELIRRQKLLGLNKNTNNIPILFVAIADIGFIVNDHMLLCELINLIQVSRALDVHFLLTGSPADFVDHLTYVIPQLFHLDEERSFTTPSHIVFPTENHSFSLNDRVFKSWQIIADNGEEKSLEIIRGDLGQLQKNCDMVVCSAFKNDYSSIRDTMIYTLAQKGIFLFELAKDPELDLKKMGCWISKDTHSDYRRIACVELLDSYTATTPEACEIILKKSFSTLRYLLEQAAFMGLPLETIALPILGAGNQGIEIEYVLSTLICQCQQILISNPSVKKLIFYEKNLEKYNTAVKILDDVFHSKISESYPKVFISYSSKQNELANIIREQLENNNISCWMAPNSIPAGCDYQEVIPLALSQTEIVLLILTPDAEQSRWVHKEIGTAIGGNKVLLPYQVIAFSIGSRFQFLLDGEQILKGYMNPEHSLENLIQRIHTILHSNETS